MIIAKRMRTTEGKQPSAGHLRIEVWASMNDLANMHQVSSDDTHPCGKVVFKCPHHYAFSFKNMACIASSIQKLQLTLVYSSLRVIA